MYVCLCHAVTDEQIRREVCDGAHSLEEIGRRLGVATGCGRCRDFAAIIVDDTRDDISAQGAACPCPAAA